jgi:hypothetical protein
MLVDLNGDGRKDIMVIKDINCTVYSYDRSSSSFASIYSSGFPTVYHRIFAGDFNGDGKTDLLTWVNSHQWYVNYSTGTSFTYSATPNSPITRIIDPDLDEWNDNYTIGDFNGDGKSDILEYYSLDGGKQCINVYYSTGNGFYKESNVVNVSPILAGKFLYDKFDDLNGDGITDIFKEIGAESPFNDQILSFYAYNQSGLVSKITNGIIKPLLLHTRVYPQVG